MAGGRRVAGVAALVLALGACATLTDVSKPVGDHTAGTAFTTFGTSGPQLSGDGRYSVFEGPRSTTDGTVEVYRHDALTDTTVRVSADATGAPVGGREPAISRDGRFVAFMTTAPLVGDDTNRDATQGWTGWDVYVRDLDTGTMSRASVDATGGQIITGGVVDFVLGVHLSADGRYVAFSTRMSAGRTFSANYYVRDRQAVGSTMVGNGYGALTAISGDGLHVLIDDFTSCITICPEQAGSHVVDWSAGTRYDLGCESGGAALSDDGRYVAVIQTAKNGCTPGVVRVDRVTGAVDPLPGGSTPITAAGGLSMTGDGNRIAVATDVVALADDTNAATDVYVGDFGSGDVGIASRTALDGPADGPSQGPSISADGRYVQFTTDATNLVAEDHDAATDVVETPALRPVMVDVLPSTAARGTAPSLTVAADPIAPGAIVTVSGDGVTVGPVTVVNGVAALTTVTVAPGATPGARDVTVTNPGPYGSAAAWCFGCLRVT